MLFRVLGEVDVERDGDAVRLGGPQQRRLLALLLSERGRVVSTDRLVEVLWSDANPPDGASRSVMKYVSRLRGVLGEDAIVTSGSGYRLELNGHRCDADEFEALVEAADREMPDVAAERYAAALGLWRGSAYGEFGSEWWARPEASRLAERRIAAELSRATSHMAMGHHNRALPELERMAAERPLDEQPVRLLMQALQATGRRAEALRVGHALRRRMADETGLDPSGELARLERAIAGDEPAAETAGRPLRGYTIHDAIGEGGHGRVYVATQPGTERRVAIKVIRPDLADSVTFVHRFEAEAQLVARLEHPHIVPLYDYWREPGGAFLVFRLLPGGTPRDSVISGGPWSLPRVSRLVEEIGAALMSAHAAGVAHNDVKASNVLLDDEGVAYLSDFGIAVNADDRSDGSQADIRGLAWTAWELLTGTRPPSERAGSSLVVGVPVRIPSLVGRMPTVPDGLDAVLRRGIDGGYASVAELVLAWRAAAGEQNGHHSPISSDSRRAAARQLARSATAGVNPYCGLRPFDEADAGSFHGRDGVAAELMALVTSHRLVTLVGASGSGKSSVVLAGLVPALRARGDVVVTLVPGDAPLDALQTALAEVATAADSADQRRLADVARRAGRLVVVVDQFEELWTRAPQAQRDAFLDVAARSLADASIDVRFVTTVRADLLDRPLEHPTIGPLVGAGSYVLGPLAPSELEAAIVHPAAGAAVMIDPAVVADLIAEASAHAGSLPLLQFTLTELYDRRVDGRVGPDALNAIGGMAGAVGRRAEEVYLALSEPGREDARLLFARLVASSTDAPDTRRRARLGELSAGMRDVADRFVGARLLVADRDPATREPTVEVAHEALLTRWSRLVAWLEEDRRWLLQLQHLAAAARVWDDGGRTDAELYRGSRLEAAIEAVDIEDRPVSDTERQFLEAGRTARDAEVRAAHRTARRLRRLLVGVAAALLVALVAGAVAVAQRRRAEDSAVAAEVEALVGRAESLRATQRDAAALLAVEAFRLADTPRTRSALLATFTDQSRFYDAHRLDGAGDEAGIVMPDGESAFLVDGDGRLQPYSLDDGSLGERYPTIGDTPAGGSILAASADGRWLAHAMRSDLGDGPTTIAVFDTRTASPRFPPVVVDGIVWSAAFTSDSEGVALAIGEEARMLVLDRDTGEQVAAVDGLQLPPRGGEIAPEPQTGTVGPVRRPPAVVTAGDDLLLGAADGSLRVLDGHTFEIRRTISVAADMLTSLRPLGDGTVLTAGRAGVARVDLANGSVPRQRDQGFATTGDSASASTCAHLAVVEQRGTFYCGNAYGRLAEHDLDTLYPIRVLDTQNGNIGSLWPARDGTELVSFGDNEPVVSRWRLDGSGPITHLVGPGYRVWRFSPNGDRLLVERGGEFDGTDPQVLEVESGNIVRTLDGLINPDWIDDDTVGGALINAEGEVETAHIDLPAGELVADGFIVDPIPNAAYALPGKERPLVVYWHGTDATLRQFDPDTERVGPAIRVEGWFSSAISRSGHRIVAGTDRGVEIYDGLTGELVGAIPGADLRGVFITVTDQLFASSLGGELTQYNLDTLEPIRSFGGSRGFITQLEGTADGTLIATKGGDHSVILYDVASGTRIGTPIAIPDDESNWMDLSLDGRWLAAGGEAADGQHATQIWNLDPRAWITAACQLAGRNLTREEWAAHIGSLAPYRPTCPDLPADD
jgi:DNA-binding SARP family transcriptional activator/WD40 repeat protein/tRNA A-37 threonylcarbamoyl transferase component Bud32